MASQKISPAESFPSHQGEEARLASSALYHYTQAHVWMGETSRLRSAGDEDGAKYAEQHATGHTLHLDAIRDQLPSRSVNELQKSMNSYGRRGDFLDNVPSGWRSPQPATEALVNGGGLNGDAKWTPPAAKGKYVQG
jgi:hypothetical protein